MTKIIIYLDKPAEHTAHWAIIDQTGHIIETALSRPLSQFPLKYKDEKILFIVPAEDVLLTTVELPKLSRHKLLQALPFAIEEELIEDVSELHFAIGHRDAKNTLPIAIVAKSKLKEWLAGLSQFDLYPNQIIPATFAVPFANHQWNIIILDNRCMVRTHVLQGFAAEKDNLSTLLELKIVENSQVADEKLPELIHVFSISENANNALSFKQIKIKESHLTQDELFRLMCRAVIETPHINLLEGTPQGKHKTAKTRKIWRLVGALSAVLILCLLINKVTSYFLLKHQNALLENKITQIYRQHFPQATNVVAPKERMTSKLNHLHGQINRNDFLALLAKAGAAFSKIKSVQIKKLEFRENQLHVTLLISSFDSLDNLMILLKKQNLQVKQQNAALIKDKVSAVLTIQRGNV